MDTTRSLDKFTCPFGGQEVELLQVGGLLERSAVEAAGRDPPT